MQEPVKHFHPLQAGLTITASIIKKKNPKPLYFLSRLFQVVFLRIFVDISNYSLIFRNDELKNMNIIAEMSDFISVSAFVSTPLKSCVVFDRLQNAA